MFKPFCCPTWTATHTATSQPTEEGALGLAQAKTDPPSWAAELYEPDPHDWRNTPNEPPGSSNEFN
eukprot:594149-Rhodomonas_salina.1